MDRQLVMVQLFCDEGASSPETVAAGSRRRSFADPHLCADGRVLTSMLRAEDGQLPSTTGHVAYSQSDLQPPMRHTVVSWMLEVYARVIVVAVIARHGGTKKMELLLR